MLKGLTYVARCSTCGLAALLLAAPVLPQNIITTFAGTDWIFPAGQRPALNAPLGSVRSLAFGPNGDLFIADSDNAIVVKVSPDGVLRVVAGNGIRGYSGDGVPATSASLLEPHLDRKSTRLNS